MNFPRSEFTGPSGRNWPLFLIERYDGHRPTLHRNSCCHWKPPYHEIGHFSTARTAFRIARLDTKDVTPCPRCCATLLPRT